MSMIRRSIATAATASKNYWYNGNYHTREEEYARYASLREEGYSNREIAKLTGRTSLTVRNHIGAQPKVMTHTNRSLGMKKYHQRKKERTMIAQKVKDAEIKKENTRCQIIDLTAKLKALKADYEAM